VYTNHLIAKDQLSVRPMIGYNIIGDVHAKGVPIAWPSNYVCYNNIYIFCVAYMDSIIFNVTTFFVYAGLNYQ